MRVAFLAPAFDPVIGGAETYVRSLAGGLARRGHEVVVITDTIDGRPDGPDHVDGVPVLRTGQYRDRLSAKDLIRWEQMGFGLLPELARLFDGSGAVGHPDVIHANSHDTAITGSMAALALRVPLVCTPHEQSVEEGPLGEGRCRLIYSHLPVARFLAGSQFYVDKAHAFGAGERAVRTYYGVDPDRFAGADGAGLRQDLGYASNIHLVVCASRLKERKGIIDLVRAVAVLVKERGWYDLRAVLAGTVSSASVEYADEVRAEIEKLRLSRVVRIVEDLGYDDMPALMRAADVVVQPSHAEGLGITLLEAMAAGTPVVGTDVVGIREVITDGDNGLLAPAKEPYGLAMALQRLRTETGLAAALTRNGERTVRDRFSLDELVERTEAVYRDVIAEARP